MPSPPSPFLLPRPGGPATESPPHSPHRRPSSPLFFWAKPLFLSPAGAQFLPRSRPKLRSRQTACLPPFVSSSADIVTPPVSHLPFLLPWSWPRRTSTGTGPSQSRIPRDLLPLSNHRAPIRPLVIAHNSLFPSIHARSRAWYRSDLAEPQSTAAAWPLRSTTFEQSVTACRAAQRGNEVRMFFFERCTGLGVFLTLADVAGLDRPPYRALHRPRVFLVLVFGVGEFAILFSSCSQF